MEENSTVNKPISVGEWVVMFIIMMVPIVNIVMLFVWGFGSNTPETKANWAKASLILIGVMILFYILMGVIFMGVMS